MLSKKVVKLLGYWASERILIDRSRRKSTGSQAIIELATPFSTMVDNKSDVVRTKYCWGVIVVNSKDTTGIS